MIENKKRSLLSKNFTSTQSMTGWKGDDSWEKNFDWGFEEGWKGWIKIKFGEMFAKSLLF